MDYFIGVDGGGTKTEIALSAADGLPITRLTRHGCSHQTLGVEAATAVVQGGVLDLLSTAGLPAQSCAGCCVGMPCYGENSGMDRQVLAALQSRLAPIPVHVVNDVEIGWAGSLACREGIHVVAGTGAVAFGRGRGGRAARCGGWNEFFGDEGSCHWVGREAMGLFSKQADGRAPRGALYGLVRRELGLEEDFDFVDEVLKNWAFRRERVAAFQLYACRAAEEGDAAAASIFGDAARELSQLVRAIRDQLAFSPGPVAVSYSGGLFKAGGLILRPFRREVEALGCALREPLHSPTEGALLLAIKHFS